MNNLMILILKLISKNLKFEIFILDTVFICDFKSRIIFYYLNLVINYDLNII